MAVSTTEITPELWERLKTVGWTEQGLMDAGYVKVGVGGADLYPPVATATIQPGDSPPASYNGVARLSALDPGISMVPFQPLTAIAPTPTPGLDVEAIGLPGLASLVAAGGTLLLWVIKAFIAKFGWRTIAAVLGTVLAAKVASMFNDPDDTIVELGEAAGVGKIVKRWKANGREFWMTDDGYMFVRLKSGVIKRWKPRKPLVLVPGGRLNIKSAVRAQRFLDRQWRTIAKRVKQLKLA